MKSEAQVESWRAIEALRAGAQDYLVKGQVDGKTLARVMRHSMVRKQAGQGQHG